MLPLNDRLFYMILVICAVMCVISPFIITLSERKNFNRVLDKMTFVSIPKTGPLNPNLRMNSSLKLDPNLQTVPRKADFIRKYAKSFDLIFTSHYSWYHGIVEYFTGSIWTHAALLYRPCDSGTLYVIEITTVDGYNKQDNCNRRGLCIETFDKWLTFHTHETQLLMLSFDNNPHAYSIYQSLSDQLQKRCLQSFQNAKQAKVVLNNFHSLLSARAHSEFLSFANSLVDVRMNTGIAFIAPIWKQKFKHDKDNTIGPQANCSEFVAHFLQQFGFLEKRYRPRCYAPGDLVYTNDYSPFLFTTYYRIEL